MAGARSRLGFACESFGVHFIDAPGPVKITLCAELYFTGRPVLRPDAFLGACCAGNRVEHLVASDALPTSRFDFGVYRMEREELLRERHHWKPTISFFFPWLARGSAELSPEFFLCFVMAWCRVEVANGLLLR